MSLDIAELAGEQERLSREPGQNSNFLDKYVMFPRDEGVVTVRILPPAPKGAFGREKNPFYLAAKLIKLNDKNLFSPNTLINGKWVGECPITKHYNALYFESDKAKKRGDNGASASFVSKAKSIKPLERYYYNCIVRSQINEKTKEKELNVGPKILSIGKQLHKTIVDGIFGNEEMDEKPLGDVTHFQTGRDFKIIKKIKHSDGNAYPDYAGSKFLDPSPLGTLEEVKVWMENLHDLTAIKRITSNEELTKQLKIHFGLVKTDKSENGGYDMSEFEGTSSPSSSAVVTTTATAPSKVAESTAKTTVPPDNNGQSLADDDFLKELQDMK